MDGTFGFVYSGATGIGAGAFTVESGVLSGVDTGGGKYAGTVRQDPRTGELIIEFSMFVPAGIFLVQGTSEQDLPYTKGGLTLRTPPDYGDGRPLTVHVPPGDVVVMIKRVPDEFRHFARGCRVVADTQP
jgi:hypothetical protein